MPSAMLKPCAYPGGCVELVEDGYCETHSHKKKGPVLSPSWDRGSAHSRGYTYAWRKWRLWYFQKLIDHGVMPQCGARWPGLPATGDSTCMLAGLTTTSRLHVDHTPPLSAFERTVPAMVMDRTRVQVLCEACHNAKSAREAAR